MRDLLARDPNEAVVIEPATPVHDMEPEAIPNTQLPAADSLEADEDIVNLDMDETELQGFLKKSLPFSDDFTTWNLMKYRSSEKLLVEYITKNIPGETKVTTANDEYVNTIVHMVFTEEYRRTHCIPRQDTEGKEVLSTSFPNIPKKVLRVFMELSLLADQKSSFVDLEYFWLQLRANFANSAIDDFPARTIDKPTASSLLSQGIATVAEEDQVNLMKQYLSKESYEAYLLNKERAREERKSKTPPEGGEVAHVQHGQENVTAALNASMLDQTHIDLRSRTVRASKETNEYVSTSVGITSRRRQEKTDISEVEKKKLKKT